MEEVKKDILEPFVSFPSTIYTIIKTEFLDDVKEASHEALEESKKLHEGSEIYPSTMSTTLKSKENTKEFEQFIAQSAWQILDNQGYAMQHFNTYVSELWCQEHRKFSSMEQHVHPYGVQLSGFYFLDTPEEGCMAELHDPRPGKVISGLPAKDPTQVTQASNSIFMKPKPGMFIFTNSWLAHSFTRNGSDSPVKFVHFNVSAIPAAPQAAQEGPVVV
jgi:uncharacterized protein (TIGR02466 family)